MAEFVLETVLGNLNSLIQNELGLFLGFDQDLERLASLFTAIKATLEDAAERQFSDRAIKDWLRKLKDAALILDDILDECSYEALGLEYQESKCGVSDKVQCSCLSSFHPKHVIFRYKIAKKMKRISERLKQIADERTQFHLTEMVPERRSGVIERPQTTSLISEPQVYGREEDTDKILNFLMGNADVFHSEDLSVYPIVGLGGLGKTTLAQLIFNHERVVNHFELKIWVCVSEDFSLKRMTEAIIEEIFDSASEDSDLQPLQRKLGDLDLQSLQRKLQILIQGKRYLLVLDDVWDDNQENWQILKSILTCGAKGTSILVTTRLQTVACIMGTVPPHELSGISENDCWELFKNRAFRLNEEEYAELVVIGREIVKKCGGVPLAAKALGGLLRFKRKKIEWLKVKESNLLEVSHNENFIMPVLRLSYLNLPTKLRQCFAFCAIYPKDERILKEDLIELWVANGFISSDERFDAEDVGEGVWNELYWRSFFQDIKEDIFDKCTTFKMHDLVHDLAQFVAEDVCSIINDNDLTVLSKRVHHLLDHRRPWTRHSFEEAINLSQLHGVKSLRTCIVQYVSRPAQLSGHVLKCYSLRVLHCKGIEELSFSIGHLKHLRYLNLSGGHFETLPESLGKLWNLLILKLDECRNLIKLPNSLINLKALRQISLNYCQKLSSLAPRIGKLTSLRSLGYYIVGKERGFLLEELGPLNLKEKLHIKHLERVKSVEDAKEANMSRKQLNELWLSWYQNEEWELHENVEEILEVLQPDTRHLKSLSVEGYKGVHFPKWMSSSPSLESLSLWHLPNPIRFSREDGENMFPRLSTLSIFHCPNFLTDEVLVNGMHSLKKLEIHGCDKFNVSAGFQCLTCLENLWISRCKEVEGLDVALQHMTSLKELILWDLPNLESLPDCCENLPLLWMLTIVNCDKLTCLPPSLFLLSSLKALSIHNCPELEKRYNKDTGEDWQKIAHIPDVIVV